MARKKGPEDDGPKIPAWMCTYADMMSLLLCFFVLIVSFSTLEEKRVKEALSSLKGALGVLETSQEAAIRISAVDPPIAEVMSLKLTIQRMKGTRSTRTAKQKEVEAKLRKLGLNNAIKIQTTEGGVRLTLPCDGILFATGSADLTPQGKAELRKISNLFEVLGTRIRIEGHTDNIPLRGGPYGDNWGLSGARALNVLRYYTQEEGWRNEDRFSYAGYGSSMPADPEQGHSTQAARAANRRVEIYIEAYDDERFPEEPGDGAIPGDDWNTLLEDIRPGTVVFPDAARPPGRG